MSAKTGVIYCRVSSAEQIDGTSLETQKQACLQYCEAHNIAVERTFIEKGESAKTTDRTEFIKAIDCCKNAKGRISFFIVWKLDRFARDTADHFKIKALLAQYGTTIRSVTEIIGEDPQGHLMETILAGFAQFDNDIRAIRSRNGMEARMKRGVWVWRAPIGYCRKAKGANLSIDPHTAPMIRKVFELYATGTHTYESIANILTKDGHKTTTGKNPFPQLIEKIIRNPLYCGTIRVWDQEFKGAFEPIIDEDLFNRCQPGYRARAKGVPRLIKNAAFPLRRLVTCATCRKPLTASASTGRHGKKYPYYHHQQQSCPDAGFIPCAQLEDEFTRHLHHLAPTLKHRKAFKAVVKDAWCNRHKAALEAKRRHEAELARLQAERERIFAAHRSGLYTDVEFLEQKTSISRRLTLAKTIDEGELDTGDLNINAVIDHALELAGDAGNRWRVLSFHDKLRFQKLVFRSTIPYDPASRFGTAEFSPIYAAFQSLDDPNSNSVTQISLKWNQIVDELKEWQSFQPSSSQSLAENVCD